MAIWAADSVGCGSPGERLQHEGSTQHGMVKFDPGSKEKSPLCLKGSGVSRALPAGCDGTVVSPTARMGLGWGQRDPPSKILRAWAWDRALSVRKGQWAAALFAASFPGEKRKKKGSGGGKGVVDEKVPVDEHHQYCWGFRRQGGKGGVGGLNFCFRTGAGERGAAEDEEWRLGPRDRPEMGGGGGRVFLRRPEPVVIWGREGGGGKRVLLLGSNAGEEAVSELRPTDGRPEKVDGERPGHERKGGEARSALVFRKGRHGMKDRWLGLAAEAGPQQRGPRDLGADRPNCRRGRVAAMLMSSSSSSGREAHGRGGENPRVGM